MGGKLIFAIIVYFSVNNSDSDDLWHDITNDDNDKTSGDNSVPNKCRVVNLF